MKQKILVATTNKGKLAEFAAMLSDEVEWLGLDDFADIPEVVEDGNTFEQNARKKALGYARATGLWTLADDSGLVVDALGGEPGVKSARYSGEVDKSKPREVFDWKNMQKVLEKLQGLERQRRSCRFVCSLCLADSERVLLQTQGIVEGFIADKPSGENGFGYDPVFYLPDYDRTVAQLSSEEKNLISHRGRAIRKLMPELANLLASNA